MKKSPFTLLRESIENELFDASLRLQRLQADGTQPNAEFFLIEKELLTLILCRADYIYKHHKAPPF